MSQVEDFLTPAEEEEVVNAIRKAEKATSGEIRVHIESSNVKNAFERSKEVFHLLKMDNTKEDNGVLFYVNVQKQSFALCGDRGIDSKVPFDFWESVKNTLQKRFKKEEFAIGLIEGIHATGIKLQEFFPWTPNDVNELKDDISKG